MGFIESVKRDSVIHVGDGYLQVVWNDIPLGGKVQTKGARCRWWRHRWTLDRYPGARHEYVDKVCVNCTRRKPLN